MVVVADGTELAAQKLERVLTNDPGSGVVRHADAGYPEALRVRGDTGMHLPMRRDRATGPSARCCPTASRPAWCSSAATTAG